MNNSTSSISQIIPKHIVVCGLGISGKAAIKALLAIEIKIWVWDDNINDALLSDITLNDDVKYDANIIDGENNVWDLIEALLISPGIPLSFPVPHPLVEIARKRNIPIIGDIELFARWIKHKNSSVEAETLGIKGKDCIIGVTGTNGKSTISSLIGHFFAAIGKDAAVVGNIGVPVLKQDSFILPEADDLGCNKSDTNNDTYNQTSELNLRENPQPFEHFERFNVIELSSWQLESAPSLQADVAVISNISPDHLDRHGSMQLYVAAKENLWRQQNKGQKVIINIDDEWCSDVLAHILNNGRNEDTCVISSSDTVFELTDKVALAICVNDRKFYFAKDKFIDIPYSLSLAGDHSAINVAIAWLAVILSHHVAFHNNSLAQQSKSDDVSEHQVLFDQNVLQLLADLQSNTESFVGLPHRIQLIGQKNAVAYVNDSKATNPESAAVALRAWPNVHWIAGGIAKRGDLDPVMPYISSVRHAYLIGEAAQEFSVLLRDKVSLTICDSLEQAVLLANTWAIEDARAELSNKGDQNYPYATVLLSPACASFDQFANYHARGQAFIEIVNRLLR